MEAHYYNITGSEEELTQLAEIGVSRTSEKFFDDKQCLIYDSTFCIERIMQGPWESYEKVYKSRDKFDDLTFPDTRMLIWHNHRTEVASHDLFPIIEIVLDDWKRLWDIGKGKY